MPEEVKNSVPVTRKRILLEGPDGSTWFLGKRVIMQSLGTTEPQVTKIPPRTMFFDYKLIDESEVKEALNGYPASKWFANSSDYVQYRDEYIRYRHYEDLSEAVTAEAATKILELNAGLNAVLFSTSLEASIEIRRLRQEIETLKNTSGTTIASSGIGQDVLADDAEHEFRTKFKHDMGRKGKTKIVIPKEHEEDEEEEEEQEEKQEDEEEDEEENEDEAWIEEKEVRDEDEEADEDGAATKGNPDAEQHSTDQNANLRKVFVHFPQRERKPSELWIRFNFSNHWSVL
ncbi:hypothetical protein PRUPE_4G269000 [Prunus persica]|uniref:Uncharacterized protein n=1 Tax=Prunus persica TaxID=3760 RepID=A0A251PRM0_PRUPE|nr:hypothetical protein PRUPE_4G269000 [Prunus persica]